MFTDMEIATMILAAAIAAVIGIVRMKKVSLMYMFSWIALIGIAAYIAFTFFRRT